MKRSQTILTLALVALVVSASICAGPAAAEENLPVYLQDRGTGVSTSMFGTYVRKGELLLYPFAEYYINSDEEYAPDEFGYKGSDDYRGDYEAIEGLIWIGYGITEDLAVEFEAGIIDATLKTDPADPSGIPDEISESGLSDVEGQLRWRMMRETESRPEAFSFFELVLPLGDDNSLIGTADWEGAVGAGVTKGFSWGTVTGRISAAYDGAEEKVEFGEYAVEYLKRINPAWKVYLAVEGEEDEVECIPELQWHFARNMTLKLNSAFGLTSKAQDWAPEVGVIFAF